MQGFFCSIAYKQNFGIWKQPKYPLGNGQIKMWYIA
jgi:hypothetical protein